MDQTPFEGLLREEIKTTASAFFEGPKTFKKSFVDKRPFEAFLRKEGFGKAFCESYRE